MSTAITAVIVPEAISNSLIIQASPAEHKIVEKLIEGMDREAGKPKDNQSRDGNIAVGLASNGAPSLILPEHNPLTLPRRPVASENTPADPIAGKYLAVIKEEDGESGRLEIELTADDNQPIAGRLYSIVINSHADDGQNVRLLGSATLENRNTLNFAWEIIREVLDGKTRYTLIPPEAETVPKTARIFSDDDKILLLFANSKDKIIIATKVGE